MAQKKEQDYEYKIAKEQLNELSSSERKALSDVEKKVADYTKSKADIDRQYQAKMMQLNNKKNAINIALKRLMNNKNSELSLRAASIYHTINKSN